MTAGDAAREIGYPLTNPTVIIALVTFYGLGELVVTLAAGGPVFFVSALIFAAFFLPALFLYLLHLLEARARGAEPAPPTVDQLVWYGNGWSLAQLLHAAIVIGAGTAAGRAFGTTGVAAAWAVIAAVLPVSIAILALTHSALESLNPAAIARLVRRCAADYWIAPAFAVTAAALVGGLRALALSGWIVHFVALYLAFALYALIGGILRPYRLQDEVDIPKPLRPDAAATDAKLAKARNEVLGHAYGLISRDNRTGGLRHLEHWIRDDPEPAAAYRWFFEQMMRWERKEPALFFGQRYLGWLLRNGEDVTAVKLILRCRLENQSFRPLPEDRDRACDAAERCQQDALADRLR